MARFAHPARGEILAGGVAVVGEIGAGNGARTRDPQLGKLMLYQLSYSRLFPAITVTRINDMRRSTSSKENEVPDHRDVGNTQLA